jgi:hypothetical protein
VRLLLERLTALAAVLFLVLALTTEPSVLIVGIAAVVLVGVMASLVTGSRELTVGARAHAHREAMSTLPAPAHPSTAGRPRTRAPSMAVPAT